MAKLRVIKRQGKCTVHPANLQVQKGETINFRVFGTDATVFAPNDILIEVGTNRPVQVLDLAHGGPGKDCIVNPKISDGAYPYAIYCKGVNDFAEGNSSPTMIVE